MLWTTTKGHLFWKRYRHSCNCGFVSDWENLTDSGITLATHIRWHRSMDGYRKRAGLPPVTWNDRIRS